MKNNACNVTNILFAYFSWQNVAMRKVILLMFMSTTMDTHQCALSNMPLVNFDHWTNPSKWNWAPNASCCCFGNNYVDVNTENCWAKNKKDGESSLCNQEWNGWSMTATDMVCKKKVELIRTINRSLISKLLSSLVLHRNVWVLNTAMLYGGSFQHKSKIRSIAWDTVDTWNTCCWCMYVVGFFLT